MSGELQLLPGRRARVWRGHPWVFANEVRGLLPAERDGDVVPLRGGRGEALGWGIYNGKSQICWRRLAKREVRLDRDFLRGRIAGALARREAASLQRLVWSESDGLPGLVVDRYGGALVVQALTLAMDRALGEIAEVLRELAAPGVLVVRNDAPVREKEGLALETRVMWGEAGELWVEHGGIEWGVDLRAGQKTGMYLDQLSAQQQVAAWARGRRVLDGFCHQGGFALRAAAAGAASVEGVDSSGPALERARNNARRNRLPAVFTEANMFDFFRARRGEKWGLIVLDPPPFASARSRLEGALRGYKELHLRALQGLEPGGILATFTCSQAVTWDVLRNLVADAAADAGREVRVRALCRQPDDHPVIVTFPESEYLRGMILEVAE